MAVGDFAKYVPHPRFFAPCPPRVLPLGGPSPSRPTKFRKDALLDSDELQQILNELPEEFRTPLILFYFDEFIVPRDCPTDERSRGER